MSAQADPLAHVVPHPLVTEPADLGILTPDGVVTVLSDQIAMLIAAGIVLCASFPLLLRRRRDRQGIAQMVPTGPANFIEMICEYFRKEVAEPQLGPYTDRFIKYVWSVFFFILTMNLLGLVPFGAITPLFGTHVGGTATGNIWVTATLALLTLGMMVLNGLRLGGKAYLAHFSPGPWWLSWLMVPLEIIGMIAKIFALAMRLFVNMVAGHILLAVLLMLILMAGAALGWIAGLGVAVVIVLASVAIYLLEIFVAFLQAFIFTYLTTLFIGMSVNVHHEEHHEATAH